MKDRPRSWWRRLFGFQAIMVIDKLEFTQIELNKTASSASTRANITDYHYEWRWRPFRKKGFWVSGPWPKFK